MFRAIHMIENHRSENAETAGARVISRPPALVEMGHPEAVQRLVGCVVTLRRR